MGRIVWLLALFSLQAHADYHLINIESVYVDYKYFIDNAGRDIYLYPEKHKEAIDLHLDLNWLSIGFADWTVKSLTTESQYRYVALNLRLGIRLFQCLEGFYEHESAHLLDTGQPYLPAYPVNDSVGLRIYFFRNTQRGSSVYNLVGG